VLLGFSSDNIARTQHCNKTRIQQQMKQQKMFKQLDAEQHVAP
jgi:hypothetical protein